MATNGTTDEHQSAIVIGAGLAGITAALELLERGAHVTVIDKSIRLPTGNSSKASVGMCAPGLHLEGMDNAELDDLAKDSMDDVLEGSTGDEFMKDAVRDVEWLLTRFFEVEKDAESILDFCCVKSPGKKGNNCVIGAKKALVGNVVCGQAVVSLSRLSKTGLLVMKSGCEVTKLLKQDGKVTGCGYTDVDGNDQEIMGAVVLATGGFGGDFATNSVMAKTKPQLLQLPTVNGEKVDGAGIVLAQEAGAGLTRLDEVNLYPLACSGPNIGDETDQFKFILSTLLLGGGGVILDADGNRFCDEKTTDPREISRLMMEKAKPPFYLVLSADELPDNVRWLCNFYLKNNVLNAHSSPGALAREMTIKHPQNRGPTPITVDAAKIEAIVGANRQCFSKIVMPAVYTCSGGVKVDKVSGAVTDKGGTAIPGLYAAGEVADGPSQTVYAKTGVPLLHCVHSGRAAGNSAATYLNGGQTPSPKDLTQLLAWISHEVVEEKAEVIEADSGKKTEDDLKTMPKEDLVKLLIKLQENPPPAAAPPAAPEPPKDEGIPMEEVAKHNTKTDVWVVVNGEVIDATKFVDNHPGGVVALMNYAGKDASEEWNTIHKRGYVQSKGVPLGAVVLGKLKGGSVVAPPPDTGPVEPDAPVGYGFLEDLPVVNKIAKTPIAALIYAALNLLINVGKTVLTTGNMKFDNNRMGTVRSGLFLVLFTVLHSSDNQFTQLGKKQYNGMSFFLADTMQKVKGYQLFDMYIGLCVLLHVSVGLKRSWDLNMGHLISTGRWNFMLTGLCILGFLTSHLIDFRFAEYFHPEGYVQTPKMYVPPYGVTLRYEAPFAFFHQEAEAPSDCIVPFLCGPGKEAEIRDLYTVCYYEFQKPMKVLVYIGFCCALIGHLYLVWPKIVGAGAFEIPVDHQPWVKKIGIFMAFLCGTLYVSVPIRFFLGVMPAP